MLIIPFFELAKPGISKPSKNVRDMLLLQLQLVGLSSNGTSTLTEDETNGSGDRTEFFRVEFGMPISLVMVIGTEKR